MQNVTISHLICHVIGVIDDLLSFRSRAKLYYTNYRSRVRCCSIIVLFVVAVVVFFKTVVLWFQKTRTDSWFKSRPEKTYLVQFVNSEKFSSARQLTLSLY